MTIEELIIQHLNSALTVPTYPEVPHNHPDSYIVIERTGGGIKDHLRTAMITVDVHGPSLLDVLELNEQMLVAMAGLASYGMVASCKLNTNYNDTDTRSKEHQYGALFDIVYY